MVEITRVKTLKKLLKGNYNLRFFLTKKTHLLINKKKNLSTVKLSQNNSDFLIGLTYTDYFFRSKGITELDSVPDNMKNLFLNFANKRYIANQLSQVNLDDYLQDLSSTKNYYVRVSENLRKEYYPLLDGLTYNPFFSFFLKLFGYDNELQDDLGYYVNNYFSWKVVCNVSSELEQFILLDYSEKDEPLLNFSEELKRIAERNLNSISNSVDYLQKDRHYLGFAVDKDVFSKLDLLAESVFEH